MNKTSISQETMKNLHIWCHSFKIPEPKPVHDTSLRIAGILGQRLTDGLCHECTMLLLLPKNWKQVLKYGKPDILLVESTWFTATGHWYMAQSVAGAEQNELREIIQKAKDLGVPTAPAVDGLLDVTDAEEGSLRQRARYIPCERLQHVPLGQRSILKFVQQ